MIKKGDKVRLFIKGSNLVADDRIYTVRKVALSHGTNIVQLVERTGRFDVTRLQKV